MGGGGVRVGSADEVDGGGEVEGAGGGGDGGARVEEFGEAGGAREGEVEGEVFGCEDEARKEGGGGADGGEGGEGEGGFDEGEDAEGFFGGIEEGEGGKEGCGGGGGGGGTAFGEKVLDYVCEEVQVGGGVAFGEDDGVEVGGGELVSVHVSGAFLAHLQAGRGEKQGGAGFCKERGLYYLSQIIQRKSTRNGVYPYGILSHPWRTELGEDMPDVFPGGGFLGQGDGVFEVVGDAVDSEGEGFLEHFGRGTGDC